MTNDSTLDNDLLNDDLDLHLLEKAEYELVEKKNSQRRITHHEVDESNLATYIYPTNLQVRDYQYNIVYRAIFDNVLVALPTGLGKTFIASTVMLNFLRWFPRLKIIFMAPTKPLVAQQIKACCGITGISSSQVAILLDKTRKNRSTIWNEKQVFFTTPQVVENDLARGIVNPKDVVLLVIDEAHRARGNYAYNNVVKFLNRFNNSFRILALTATPASDVDGVQEIIDNLCISKVEVRTERSIDIFKYLKRKVIERITVSPSPEIVDAIDMICQAIEPILETANQRKIYEITDPAKINAFAALDAQQKIIKNPNIPEGLKWSNYFILQLLVVVGQCFRRLNIYGIRSFYSYFYDKYTEFSTKYNNKKSTNHLAAKFYFHSSIKGLLHKCEGLVKDPTFLGHPKLEVLISELTSFFENTNNSNSRVIVFTEFRESALDIVRALEAKGDHLKPHIFIGQAKEKEKFDEEKFLKKGKKSKGKDKKQNSEQKQMLERPGSSSERAQISGMNQKMQKQLIKDFKKGSYNILVATSIGEEGLDIGEVDLIVCYDSTSSPIKNVQRMGRTGRNRDGKVLLLFSSNEELKFDKAMGGYEYIQQHIMNGNMVTLHDQNRILPPGITPVAEEKLIEIPKENEDIKAEDDEDEIIKIATKYMTKTKTKLNKLDAKKGPKTPAPKAQKQFFMPENVNQGFTPVSTMLKRRGEDESIRDKRQRLNSEKEDKRDPDILDSFLDSDNDHGLLQTGSNNESAGLLNDYENGKHLEQNPTYGYSERISNKSLLPIVLNENLNSNDLSQVGKEIEYELNADPLKRQLTIVDQLQAVQKRSFSDDANNDNGDDAFDDDDDEILALARSSSFSFPQSSYGVTAEESNLVPIFTQNEGFLTDEQNLELYLSYYVPTDASALAECYVPLRTPQRGGRIGHGKVSLSILKSQEYMEKTNRQDKRDLLEVYKEVDTLAPTLGEVIEF